MNISDQDRLIELSHEYEATNTAYATAEAELLYGDETRKLILAEEFLKAKVLKNNFGKYPSNDEANAIARSSERFKSHIKDLASKKEEAIRLRGKRDAIRLEWESMRSIFSAEKTLANLNVHTQK